MTATSRADRAGLSVRYLGQLERGQESMSVTVLGRLADALAVDATKLVKGTRSAR